MAYALQLARRGFYTTQPNPRVGCVLVREGRSVGEGWHRFAGQPHAERLALNQAGEAARGATAYITLEPCAHHGRTPPCADALVAAGVARVVAAMRDPNPLVAGAGLERLRAAGLSVEVGLLEEQARALNPGFVARMEQRRPFVRLKLASSLDGRTAMASGESRWITSAEARRDVHRYRAASSAVLSGVNTVLADDPSLDVRLPLAELAGVQPGDDLPRPLRVVLDSGLRLVPTARLLTLPGEVLVLHQHGSADAAAGLRRRGARVQQVPGSADSPARVDLTSVLSLLAQREVNELWIECGPTLAGAWLQAGLVDELVLYIAPHLMGDAARPLMTLPGLERMADRVGLDFLDVRHIGPDLRIIARPHLPAS